MFCDVVAEASKDRLVVSLVLAAIRTGAVSGCINSMRVYFYFGASRMTVLHRLELPQNIDRRLFVGQVLRKDCNFIFPVFSTLFCWLTLDVGLFSNLRLHVDCFFIIDCCYKIVRRFSQLFDLLVALCRGR